MTEKSKLNSPQLQNRPDSAPRLSGNTWSPAAHPRKPGRSNAVDTETPPHCWDLASPRTKCSTDFALDSPPISPSRKRESRKSANKPPTTKEEKKNIITRFEAVGGVVRVGIERLFQYEPLLVLKRKNCGRRSWSEN